MYVISKSVEYTQKAMDEALEKVKTFEANLGGTEILKPLKHILSQPCIPNQPRQVRSEHMFCGSRWYLSCIYSLVFRFLSLLMGR